MVRALEQLVTPGMEQKNHTSLCENLFNLGTAVAVAKLK